MVEKIKITNLSKNISVELLGSEGNFILDSIDWDMPSVSMDTYRIPYQVGASLSGLTVGTRQPAITGYVIGITESSLGDTWEDYYKKQLESIEQNKLFLDSVISVYQDVLIEANGYKLKARPTQPPKYSIRQNENNDVLCFFSLGFECYGPMFYQDSKTNYLSTIEKMFHFKLIIPQETGVMFGVNKGTNNTVIDNNGDSPVGIVVTFKAATGTVKNPVVYNIETNKFIGVDGIELFRGDVLTINTETGEESVKLHRASTGEDEIAIGYLLPGSTFLKADIGKSYFAYRVDEGYERNADVSIKITEQYFNIKGM